MHPEKAEEVARYCDFFWIAAPARLVPVPELPSAWGLFEVDPDGRTAVTKKATKTKADKISREFTAALLRAASRPVDSDTLDSLLAARRIALDEQFTERVKAEAARLTRDATADAQHWSRLCAALGIDPQHLTFIEDATLMEAVKLAMHVGPERVRSVLEGMLASLDRIRAPLVNALAPVAEAKDAAE